MDNESGVRLNKYISQSGFCSRREADQYIENGKVEINGKAAGIGSVVNSGDEVHVVGKLISPKDETRQILIALNKPVGIVSTTESAEKDNIVDFVGHPTRIFPIGRLDKDSEGLIFLTSDGDLVNKILRAGNNHEKEYLVTVNKPITEDFISRMGSGVPILGVVTKGCKVEKVSTNTFRITLIQGLNRQIRRMCEHFEYEVVKLERKRIMNVSLGSLKSGDWRDLTDEERSKLFSLIKDSSSEDKKKVQKKAGKKTQQRASKKSKFFSSSKFKAPGASFSKPKKINYKKKKR